MIIRNMEEIIGSKDETIAENGNWASRRMLYRKDNMGFTLTETIIKAGTKTHIWYQNHLEAVYCISGDGRVETLKDGKEDGNVYPIKPGIMYALDEHDEHYLYGGKEDMRLICVFNPPLTGNERHDENGVYPVLED